MEQMVEIQDARHSKGRAGTNGAPEAGNVVLGPRDTLNGALTVEGNVRILGSVEGEISATGDVDLEPSATVQARIEGRNVNVRGNLTGDVVARGRLSVAGSGIVNGDVRAPRLQVDDGATVNGSVTMSSAEKAAGSGDSAR